MGQQAQNLPQFELARKRLKQRAGVAQQEQESALKRQFARTGLLSSGAATKTLQKGRQELFKQQEAGLEGIQAAETAERRRMREIQEARDFQSQQAQQQREFAGTQAELGRQFTGGEAEKGRQFQRGIFDVGQKFKEQVFSKEFGNKLQLLDLEKQQFQLDRETTSFNKVISALGVGGDDGINLLASLVDNPDTPPYLKEGLGIYVESVKKKKEGVAAAEALALQPKPINQEFVFEGAGQ